MAYVTITLTLYQPVTQRVPDAPVVLLGSRTVEVFCGGWQLLISLLLSVLILGASISGWWLWRRHQANWQPTRLATTVTT